MTRALIRRAIACRRFVQGETKPVERYVLVPLAVLTVAAVLAGWL